MPSALERPPSLIELATPHEWQQRVMQEKVQLDERITKLNVWLAEHRVPWHGTDAERDEDFRMRRQLYLMKCLSAVLGERIAHFVV